MIYLCVEWMTIMLKKHSYLMCCQKAFQLKIFSHNKNLPYQMFSNIRHCKIAVMHGNKALPLTHFILLNPSIQHNNLYARYSQVHFRFSLLCILLILPLYAQNFGPLHSNLTLLCSRFSTQLSTFYINAKWRTLQLLQYMQHNCTVYVIFQGKVLPN